MIGPVAEKEPYITEIPMKKLSITACSNSALTTRGRRSSGACYTAAGVWTLLPHKELIWTDNSSVLNSLPH